MSIARRTLSAPAKVNLLLKILGRRPDGYHDLRMILAKLDLADTIDYELYPEGDGTEMGCDHAGVPTDASNILWKVADRVRQESGHRFGLKLFLHKKTPTAAGLGGGSSDGASLLLALNRDLELNWDHQKMNRIGAQIGADVPFFLVPGPQMAEGIGERLTPTTIPEMPLILINPNFPVSTKDAYRWFDEEGLTDASVNDSPDRLFYNDLEKVVIPRYPVLAEIQDLLKQAGALGALMSGSGPTVFGWFQSTALRDRGYEILSKRIHSKWWMSKAVTKG